MAMTYEEYMTLLQEQVINVLNKGINPWQAPWEVARNGYTNRPYRGINALYLELLSNAKYEGESRYFTFDQAKELGASVRKGEKSQPVFFFQTSYKKKVLDEDGKPVLDENGKPTYELIKTHPIFKVYPVFNAKQLDNLPEVTKTVDEEKTEYNHELAEEVIQNSPVPINYVNAPEAFYSPSNDRITMPPKERFSRNEQAYYSTAFHEMAHSTGNRLNRNMSGRFGDPDYAREELIAEITALTVCDKCEMHYTNENSAAYIASWATMLNDPEFKLSDLYKEVTRASSYLLKPEDRLQITSKAYNEVHELTLKSIKENRIFHIRYNNGNLDFSLTDLEGKEIGNGTINASSKSMIEQVAEIAKESGLDLLTFIKNERNEIHNSRIPEEFFATEEQSASEDLSVQAAVPNPEPDLDKPIANTNDLRINSDPSEPVVRIDFSESPHLSEGETIPLSKANSLFAELNANRKASGELGYDKTWCSILFQENGLDQEFKINRFDIGSEKSDIITHINESIDYMLSGSQSSSLSEEELETAKYVKTVIVPFLERHIQLSEIEDIATQNTLPPNQEPTDVIKRPQDHLLDAYFDYMQSYVKEYRTALNNNITYHGIRPISMEVFRDLHPEIILQEPQVTFTKSDFASCPIGKQLSLYEAGKYLQKANEEPNVVDIPMHGPEFFKIKGRNGYGMRFSQNGKVISYIPRYTWDPSNNLLINYINEELKLWQQQKEGAKWADSAENEKRETEEADKNITILNEAKKEYDLHIQDRPFDAVIGEGKKISNDSMHLVLHYDENGLHEYESGVIYSTDPWQHPLSVSAFINEEKEFWQEKQSEKKLFNKKTASEAEKQLQTLAHIEKKLMERKSETTLSVPDVKKKTEFTIEYLFNGQKQTYKGYITLDKQSKFKPDVLIDNIKKVSAYMQTKTSGALNTRWKTIEHSVVPFLRKHYEISTKEARNIQELSKYREERNSLYESRNALNSNSYNADSKRTTKPRR